MNPETPSETIEAIDEHGAQVQSMFTDIAHGYDLANRCMSMGTDVRWRKKAVATMLPQDAPSAPQILDLCAGTLDSSRSIHRHHPNAQIVGGDFSAGMLAAGEKSLSATEREHIEPKEMDAHALPEPDNRFDAMLCAFGLRNLSDLQLATDEMRRVLRPGGKLTILEFFKPTNIGSKLFHSVYNNTVLPTVGWLCTGNLAAYRYLPKSISKFVAVEEYAELMRKSGFENVEITPLTGRIACLVRGTVRATN